MVAARKHAVIAPTEVPVRMSKRTLGRTDAGISSRKYLMTPAS
jgi:hypothetical protein